MTFDASVQSTPVGADLSELSAILWRERELLDLLLFKLEEEQLLLAAGRSRWLGRATHEVEVVLQEIRKIELARALEVQQAGNAMGLGDDASLRELADAAGSPWTEILLDHRDAFLAATEGITAMAEANRELLTASSLAVQEVLARMGRHDTPTYTANAGRAAAPSGPARLFDQVV